LPQADDRLIEEAYMYPKIHDELCSAGIGAHVVMAGAGLGFLHGLWTLPGSSAYLWQADLVQSTMAMDRFLGYEVEGSRCSQAVAVDLATRAYLNAETERLASDGSGDVLGLGLTASVATNRMPRGRQRFHAAIIGGRGVFLRELELEKREGEAARAEHDGVISRALVDLLHDYLNAGGESQADDVLMERILERPRFISQGCRSKFDDAAGLYFPANLNPVHEGHWMACERAEPCCGLKTVFMLEACPPNKELLTPVQLLQRVAQAQSGKGGQDRRDVLVTHGWGNYIDKVRHCPGSRFIVGADALIRLLEPCWGYDVGEMLRDFEKLDCRFYVAGRLVGERFVTLDEVEIDADYRYLFEPLDGRRDISSSELRKAEGEQQ